MNKKILFITLLFLTTILSSQTKSKAFKGGEWLRYKMSYSGFLKAGSAELSVKEKELDGKKVFHSTAKGWTSGMVSWFFKVKDTYESYFDQATGKPYFFKRNIDEGGYKKKKEIRFNYNDKKAYVKDVLKRKDTSVSITNVQDMISAFYYLRNQNTDNLKEGEAIEINMFFDEKTYPFKLKFLGRETLKTKFGKVKTLKFRPIVQAGRVFKEQESVTVWITADDNKIPIKMKASLSVGSLSAELEGYKGLANSFKVVFD
ncbi:DUF3108 domain-containing protein [Tenacibaculum aquimarinum]|uniref:DUF3108 domain-containing protein n=1 Tax=Tenacibaculum aquimarinum TaxID=2910675 RepID=UPI001F0A5538|nr:DUF3108 domain-containing protein [Tenacibaculum aquimarinum]MCH3881198.1 DUF3108 domain-containing protein [Tenacibaculum aquimarinum]